jgi:hypothetical protein
MTTETRMFVGPFGSHSSDKLADFRIGEIYLVRITRLTNGAVTVTLDQSEPSEIIQLSSELFEKWFIRAW